MIELLKWWLLLFVIGIACFPLTFVLFSHARTRGYGISKVFGLLIWGYIFWLGNGASVISNTRNGSLLTLTAIFVLAFTVFLKNKPKIFDWLRQQKEMVIFSESLFLISVLAMLIIRLPSPDIIGTEKPMELAFLNGISQSTHFPPQDPWLSGYSISYYYFGYLIINLAVKLLATPTGVAFNLGLIFWFGLIAQASSDCLINLLGMRKKPHTDEPQTERSSSTYLVSLLAPVFILVVSNSEGMLELLHSLGAFWTEGTNGIWQSRFWTWIHIEELTGPPTLPLDWNIFRPGATWWWRASRVLQDYTLAGQSREIINEFPFFSFFLGDLHPHLLAIPFVLLSVAAAFEVYQQEVNFSGIDIRSFFAYFHSLKNWIIAFVLGSLIFLNTWDFPIYFALVALVILYKTWDSQEGIKPTIKAALLKIFALGLMAIVLYSPFLTSFSSQAGGVLPSLIFQSRSIHQLVMFLPLLIPILLYLFFHIIPEISWKNWIITFLICTGIYIFGIVLSYGYAALTIKAPMLQQSISMIFDKTTSINVSGINQQAAYFLSNYEAQSVAQLISSAIHRVILDPWMKLIFLICISTPAAFILQKCKQKIDENTKANHSDTVWGMLLIIASVLVLFPEVFYLRDQFGWRMNTIFKFYFQAWILLSMCASYAVVMLISSKRVLLKLVMTTLSALAVLSGLIYPLYAIKERVSGIRMGSFDLDGTHYFSDSNPAEMAAIEFIKDTGCGVVAEAVGGSYTNYARVSKFSGCQTVLGWPGHEMQWRGSSDLLGTREADIRELYTTNDWLSANRIIQQYQIDYIFVGDLERTTYQVEESKFLEHLPVVFKNDQVVIYARIDNDSHE